MTENTSAWFASQNISGLYYKTANTQYIQQTVKLYMKGEKIIIIKKKNGGPFA